MEDFVKVTDIFGCDVFNDSVMQERLPKKVYKELKKTIEEGKEPERCYPQWYRHDHRGPSWKWYSWMPVYCR